MEVHRCFLSLLPMVLAACGGGGDCIDIGIPSGVQVVTDGYTAEPGTTVEVCADQSCGSLALADVERFLPLPLRADDQVELVVTVRDAAAQELVRSTATVEGTPVEEPGACDSGGPQVTIRLGATGRAQPAS
jgi:hypothetical protein